MKFNTDDFKNGFNKDKIGNWIVKYKRQVAVGCILICLIVVAAVSLNGKDKKEDEAKADAAGAVAASAQGEEEQQPEEEPNDLEKDAYPEVNAIVQQYYDSMAAGDVETLATIEDEISEEEKERILRSKDIVEGYQNISCYTKRGLEEGSYLVFVYYEQKFVRIETPAPGLSPLYVCTRDDGSLYIFNGEVSPELEAYVEQMAQEADVVALREEVKAKYEEAKASDEELMQLEERYTKVASAETEEPEEAPAEEQPEETEEPEASEETPEETGEEEQPEEEQPADNNAEATAQNRETRFTESVRLRAEPSTEAEYLGTAYQGEHLTQIESYADGWSKINYNGKECYCKTEFLE